MKHRKASKYTVLVGWFITALVIVLVAPLIVPEGRRSDYFWYRVIWTEVLCFFVWGSASFYIFVPSAQKDSATRFGGIAPTISIVTYMYAILSFSVMVIHAFLSGSDTASRIHWILQIVLFTLAALSVVFLSISREAATSGLDFDRAKVLTPKELHDLLVAHESSLRNSESLRLRSNIKHLRESLLYSLSESTSLAELPEYQALSQEIKAFCDSITGLPDVSVGQLNQLNSLNESAISLAIKTKLISSKQIRR